MIEINNNLLVNVKAAVIQMTSQATVWWGILRDKISCWLRDLDLTPDTIIEICTYAGGGFLVGFLLKKYFRMGIILIVLLVAAGWALVEFDLITINWGNAQNLTHVAPSDTLGNVLANLAFWVKAHLVIVVSGLVGFLIGHKAG